MMKRKLLVVVDVQKDFVNGSLGFEGAEAIIPVIVNKIEVAKSDPEYAIAVTLDTHEENYMESREGHKLPVLHCVKGSSGWQLNDAVAEALSGAQYITLEKPSFGLNVDAILKLKESVGESIEEIHVCGLVSNICVISNVAVLQANYPEATLHVDAKATASFDDALNVATLKVLEGLQVTVSNS